MANTAMSAYFFDTSAIVKRYHREPGTAWIQSLCEPRDHAPLYLSQPAHVEVIAALRRVGRTQSLHSSFVDTMVNRFQRHITLSDSAGASAMYRLVPITPPVLALAAELCDHYSQSPPQHLLRSLDAVQLACALAAAAAMPDQLVFVTADLRLAAIAPLEGLRVVNPAFPPQP